MVKIYHIKFIFMIFGFLLYKVLLTSRQDVLKKSFLAKFGFDTAQNEPLKGREIWIVMIMSPIAFDIFVDSTSM